MAQDSPNKSTPAAGLPDEQQMERITDFFHEAGHLRHTPRSGYAFLGSGSENVAEHSYRTSVIGLSRPVPAIPWPNWRGPMPPA